jgi:hypothetical protein
MAYRVTVVVTEDLSVRHTVTGRTTGLSPLRKDRNSGENSGLQAVSAVFGGGFQRNRHPLST